VTALAPAAVRPHLLIDARPLTGVRNGVTRVVEQLLKAWPEAPEFDTTLISNRPMTSNEPLPAGVGCHVDGGVWARIPGSIWMTLRAKALARQLGATHFLGTAHVLPLLGVAHLHTGVIVHDLVFDKFPETMQMSNRLMSRYFAPRSIRLADRIFCMSATTRHDLELYLGKRLPQASVTYPGVTQQKASPSDLAGEHGSDTALRLLVVGSLEPRKNIPQFLKIFLELSKIRPDVRLDIVSSSSWGNVLDEKFRNEVDSHPRIKAHERISDGALDSLYRASDFLVFPSIYEGFGLPILEAVGKCGVIANDIPIFRELAGHMTGVHLFDLAQDPRIAAQHLSVSLPAAEPAEFLSRETEALFQWQTCARDILTGMGLPIGAGHAAQCPRTTRGDYEHG
jgi:glycosyltransferase involved in cell wall biosynthesis